MHVCVRNPEFKVAIDSRILAVRASRAHEEHYVSATKRPRQSSPVRRPENMSFISQDDSLFALFHFYGGSDFPARSPLLENKFIALLSSPRLRNVRLKQPAALSLGTRNFGV